MVIHIFLQNLLKNGIAIPDNRVATSQIFLAMHCGDLTPPGFRMTASKEYLDNSSSF